MPRVLTFSIFLLALIAVTNGASNSRSQALVQSQVIPQSPTAPEVSSQVSGHVYRADTGAPVEGATIVLQSTRGERIVQRSNSDGSYIFSDVAAGSYVVMAYGSGFAGPVEYGNKLVSVTQGRTVGGIDVRLTANPSVTTLLTEPIAAATYPDHKLSFDQVRFSPDGQIAAIVTHDSITSSASYGSIICARIRVYPLYSPAGFLWTRLSKDSNPIFHQMLLVT